MALSLNTSHPLYGNLIALFVNDGGTIKDLVTPARTITPHANVTYGSGAYGDHFRVVAASNTSPNGVDFGEIEYDTSSNPVSWFAAFNDIEGVGDGTGRLFGNPESNSERWPNIQLASDGKAILTSGQTGGNGGTTTTDIAAGTTERSVAYTRAAGDGSTKGKLYVDGTLEVTGDPGFSSSQARVDYIGGNQGFNAITAKIFVIVFLNKVLSDAEVASLDSSLTGSNAFGLLTASGGGSSDPAAGSTLFSGLGRNAFGIRR